MRHCLLVLIFVLCTVTIMADIPGSNLLDSSYVHRIDIISDHPNFLETLYQFYRSDMASPEYGHSYLPATVILDSTSLDSVGVRFKGRTSFGGTAYSKNSFKLDFNEFIDQAFDGLKKVNVHNMLHDRGKMNEHVMYGAFRKSGVPAPRTAYTELYVNNEYYGLYLLVEQIDKRFLGIHFPDKKGDLFKAHNANLCWYSDNPFSSQRLERKTNESSTDTTGLVHFLDILNNTDNALLPDLLPSVFDVETFMKTLVIDIFAQDTDHYWAAAPFNYYIYQDSTTQRFHYIPWDYDFAFTSMANYGIDYMGISARPLVYRILHNETLRQQYLQFAYAIMQTNLTQERLFPLIDSTDALIRNLVYSDPKKMTTNADYDNATADATNSNSLKHYLAQRINRIQTGLDELGITSTASCIPQVFSIITLNNYPNPFNPETTIQFNLPQSGNVELNIYNIKGQKVKTLTNEVLEAGQHSVSWNGINENGEDVASGVYFYRLTTADQMITKKMMLMK